MQMPSARPYRFSIKRRWVQFCALILRTVEDACSYNYLYPCVAHFTSSLLLLTYYLKKTASAVFFTLCSVVDNFIIVFINQIADKHKLITLVFQAFKNCRQCLGGVVGIIVEKHNTAVFNLTCHPLTNTVCRCIFFPVKTVNIRNKSNNKLYLKKVAIKGDF